MPSRAVVSITNTLHARASKLVTSTIKHMADLKTGTSEIRSSENLKAAIDEVNAKYKAEALKAKKEQHIPDLESSDDENENDHPAESSPIPTIVITKRSNGCVVL